MLYIILKRILDILLAAVLWILLSPVLFIVAILIKLTSKGPVFVPDCVRLYKFRPFFMYKFRTMKLNGQEILEGNPKLKEVLKNDHKISVNDDPRVTRLGKFLRLTDLDETPQLLNVIFGQMSLVGPRPYMLWEIEEIINGGSDIDRLNMRKIQKVKPGMTGLWQISGRNTLPFSQRVEIDAMYARNRNFFLDLKILLKTPKILITGKGRK
ncbi:MAG: sugar transferase [Candidatus Dojkabacteria bacterium]|jgi:lipopolysaccharide/colanic/teichoic acid biosynthesis glycosyltransferase|nr:sugar transferase [Candidatus Dojkabacteria bacterium]MDD2270374.1 sugar transferase [Candidatus Dojkabacteria bacterium]